MAKIIPRRIAGGVSGASLSSVKTRTPSSVTGKSGVKFWWEEGGFGGGSNLFKQADERRMGLGRSLFDGPKQQIDAMISGLRNLTAGRRLRNMIGRYAGQAVARNFRQQQGPGGRWDALTRKTKTERER